MSTRSMTIIAQSYDGDGRFVPLYRHCDGYPAEAGKALSDILDTCPKCPEDILAALLALRYDDLSSFRTYPEPIYRAATWQAHEQGDLEHVYEVRPVADPTSNGVRRAAQGWEVKHWVRSGWGQGTGDYRNWPGCVYTQKEFAFYVQREVDAMAKRVLIHAKRNSLP
jgi:hypothetical protein